MYLTSRLHHLSCSRLSAFRFYSCSLQQQPRKHSILLLLVLTCTGGKNIVFYSNVYIYNANVSRKLILAQIIRYYNFSFTQMHPLKPPARFPFYLGDTFDCPLTCLLRFHSHSLEIKKLKSMCICLHANRNLNLVIHLELCLCN